VLVAMVTNSSKARFSIGPSQCYIKKATKAESELVYAGWSSESVFGFRVSQSTLVRE
jgi:hypothetical protein